MDDGSPISGMEQEQCLRKRFGSVIGAATLSTILALGLSRAYGWSVLTAVVLGSVLSAVGLAGEGRALWLIPGM